MFRYTKDQVVWNVLEDGTSKMVARHTYMKHDKDTGQVYLRYKQNVLIEWLDDEHVVLHGGDRTDYEKKLFARFLFFQGSNDRVYKKDGRWFAQVRDHFYHFTDGMTLHDHPGDRVTGALEINRELPVVFRRKHGSGEIIALLPTEPWDQHGRLCRCYTSAGKADRTLYESELSKSRLALQSEYTPLYTELVEKGWNLQVVNRASQKHHELRQTMARKLVPA